MKGQEKRKGRERKKCLFLSPPFFLSFPLLFFLSLFSLFLPLFPSPFFFPTFPFFLFHSFLFLSLLSFFLSSLSFSLSPPFISLHSFFLSPHFFFSPLFSLFLAPLLLSFKKNFLLFMLYAFPFLNFIFLLLYFFTPFIFSSSSYSSPPLISLFCSLFFLLNFSILFPSCCSIPIFYTLLSFSPSFFPPFPHSMSLLLHSTLSSTCLCYEHVGGRAFHPRDILGYLVSTLQPHASLV